jgi:type II secretory pathway component PulJ
VTPITWLLAQVGADPLNSLLQYGALGMLALFSLLAVRVLFSQETKAHELDRARADRLEQELRQLNKDVQELVMPAVTKATEAITEAMRLLREHR